VHGVGKQLLGEQLLLSDWLPALRDGVTRAGGAPLADTDVAMAFYGDLFRPAGQTMAVGDPLFTAADVAPGLETELLLAWWEQAAKAEPAVPPPDGETMVRAPRAVQTALRALSRSRFFAGIAMRAMVFDLKQAGRYVQEPQLRAAARARVAALIGPDTRVVVAHSLGTLVAYETLCQLSGHGVRALVTMGSPIGTPNLFFDRLEPAPVGGVGAWPGERVEWTNVVDRGDVVALVEDLRPMFGERVRGFVVHNGPHAHDARSYLSDAVTGAAVAGGLDG
jgi:hypothetical protein